MKKLLLISCMAMTFPQLSWGGTKVAYTATITRDASRDTDSPTVLRASVNALCEAFGRPSEESFETGLETGTIKFVAKQGTTNSVYATATYGAHGHWFNHRSIAVAANSANRRVACQYSKGYFYIIHNPAKTQEGETYTFTQMFIQSADTVAYTFTVTLGTPESVNSDQPVYEEKIVHRADIRDAWPITPLMKQNDRAYLRQNYIQVNAGDDVTFSVEYDTAVYKSASFQILNRTGKSLRSLNKNPYTLKAVEAANAGHYTVKVRLVPKEGTKVVTHNCLYFIDVLEQPLGSPFSWEGRIPQFSHDWKSDAKFNYGVYEKPTKNLGDVSSTDRSGKPVNRVDGEWWTCVWGSNLNKEAGAYDSDEVRKAAENMMAKYDSDFAYIRDQMGWPPDLRARNGYRSLVYIFGSGLQQDNTANTEKGGYQSALWYSDAATGISANWPCVWASYYPFSRFRDDADSKWSDGDYQREAMVHEGIHAIFADLGTCHKSSWFHEAGNVWLQSAMNSERYNVYGDPGFLDACPFIAPFMPIECYSGWLQDGSFGGPQAEGVNMYNGSQQVCTWRNLLGGTQYGCSFPIVLGEICGKGSIPWIWRNCEDYVLKGIGSLLGEETMRQLILQYRARMATFDIGGWKKGYRAITDGNMGLVVKPEWEPYWINVAPYKLSPYQTMTKNDNKGWLAPDSLTTPGWSGMNTIPIHVDSKANSATVEFRPEDTEMRAQLCYVTKAGKNYYSQPAHCGKLQIDLTDRPANEVIFLVVCNTDYIFVNDEVQRKHHWEYRIRLLDGALATADPFCRWYFNEQTITDPNYNEDIARAAKEDYEEDSLVTLADITTLISKYMQPDTKVKLADITTLINSYQAQANAKRRNAVAIPGSNGVKLMTGFCQAGHPIQVQLADGISPADVRVNILGLSGIIADDAPLQNAGSYTLPANLQPGLYFIKFTQNGLTDTYKVVIK